MTEPIVSIHDLTYRYEQQNVLENITLNIPKGSFAGLVGPNGSGKTTLIKLILGIYKVQTGDIKLFGTSITKFRNWHKIGFVSQKANSFNKGFPATVYEVVAMGLTRKLGYFQFLTKQHKVEIVNALKQVGMEQYIHQNIGDLSGGQQQRVFIARALVSKPELLILDEPTVGVDTENVDRFYKLLAKLNREQGITLLLVSHDIGTITTYVTDLLCLNKTLHFHGNPGDFEQKSDKELSQFYGHAMHTISHNH
ncbi:metal ABC transporter ATP-binding protein [Salirhabdus salicampi]|uniref:metal ABC transporter ATP-binding protein n=1 Tax=Salirhabdus salicampi TaxID=476102 RepID=UPI0020C1D7CE|nr:metal ABC transporter ATP-binding protein [Salirhabdus salicampi]MCP8617716.1 metal ABC transporter ATP-binding protein [Salirhabdus salicampi]